MAKNINRKVTIYINGCDLLLFSYLCKVLDNKTLKLYKGLFVVICFYFRIFAKS